MNSNEQSESANRRSPASGGSAKYTLEWQMPNGKWDRWSSKLDSPEDVIARAKFFFRDWLEMPAMRIIEISPNAALSEAADKAR